MRIALAQTNPIVGDIVGNSAAIARCIDAARNKGASLVVFPELAVIGYPPKDLLLKPAIIDECDHAIRELATHCVGITAIIGYPCPSDRAAGRSLYNAAALCRDGAVAHRFVKSLLPTYDVFDEQRYFEPGPASEIVVHEGAKLGVSICEDLWNDRDILPRQLYHNDPIAQLAAAGAGVMVNCSASPFVLDKHAFRLSLFASAAKRHGTPLIYCNQVGGNDELVFDGNSCVVDATGKIIAQAKDFEEDLLIVDMDAASNRVEKPKRGIESVYHALVLGLRDYCRKCGFKSIVLGLSGGIDSALCATLAVAALGKENVRGVAMPSRFSSDHSVSDARDLAVRLGIKFHVIAIEEAHKAMEHMVAPHFEGKAPDTTEENVQARIRGVVLMSFSNKFGSLLVTTGNKSELAVGYCTLYGDMCGGLAVISDVPKTMVWELSRWINNDPASPMRGAYNGAVIPESSISKVPSAELRPNQTDQDSLPPYEVLDQIIERYVEREQTARQIIAEMPATDPAVIFKMVRLIDLNEYKRKQAAPGIKVTGRAFGFGRRMPIAQRYDNGRSLKKAAAVK
ncbi:MAG: NAD+ synthase [Planctomycetes bacterium]|nr:NAD+ synthase [Planctomycetota bacterium]